MTPNTCPDCNSGLRPGADRCRCGWTRPGQSAAPGVAPAAVRYCATVGCEQRVNSGRVKCESCETSERQRKSDARCRELGLTTVDEKRAYCKSLARKIGRGPTFEDWTKTLTQKTVDIIERTWGHEGNKLIERLRYSGVIDGRNKLIPIDAREVAAEVQRAERARAICEMQSRGIVRVPGQDDEEIAA